MNEALVLAFATVVAVAFYFGAMALGLRGLRR